MMLPIQEPLSGTILGPGSKQGHQPPKRERGSMRPWYGRMDCLSQSGILPKKLEDILYESRISEISLWLLPHRMSVFGCS